MSDSTSFRSVLRGYDPAQVDQWQAETSNALAQARNEAAERTVEVSELRAALTRAQEQHAGVTRQFEALQDEQRKAAAPTFADLGDRIGSILTLADQEATDIRDKARVDADTLVGTSQLEADQARKDADAYAVDVRGRADAEAAQVVEKAKQQADSILDDADREASARREEAEAFYEHQRARAAAAAADFESTLGQRRDKAAAEFSAQMAQHEQALTQAQERAAALSAESERAHSDASTEAQRVLAEARSEAEQLVAAAREQAERIRRDSERELAAATARRDSITAQLSNVRQMLATLGGASMVDGLGADDKPAQPAAAVPEATAGETDDSGAETAEATAAAEPDTTADEADRGDETSATDDETSQVDEAADEATATDAAKGRKAPSHA
jgi:cell division septum initiation protein DivIVA